MKDFKKVTRYDDVPVVYETRVGNTETKYDPVNHPRHYTGGKIECIDAIEAATKGLEGYEAFLTGNVIKYMWRWKQKGGQEDLQKARWYLDRLITEKK